MVDNLGIPVDNSTLAVDNVATGVDSWPRLVGATGCRPILTLTVPIIHLYLPAHLAEVLREGAD